MKEGGHHEKQEGGSEASDTRAAFLEKAKKDTFDDIYFKVVPLIADENYAMADKEIDKAVKVLAEAYGGPVNEVAYKLKKEFEAGLPPEILGKLNMESLEARTRKGRAYVAQLNRIEQMEKRKQKRESESLQAPEFLNQLPWKIPMKEIKPGLVIEVENRKQPDGKWIYEVMSDIEMDEKGLYAYMSEPDGTEHKIHFADIGILPYPDESWNQTIHPSRWRKK